MGIYVPKMKMPNSCLDCHLSELSANGEIYCPLTNTTASDTTKSEDCPLIEVCGPHGPLIDADKQHKRLQKQVMALYSEKSDKYSYLMDVLYSIHGEPTVIEAER